jgi:hypothetical protein
MLTEFVDPKEFRVINDMAELDGWWEVIRHLSKQLFVAVDKRAVVSSKIALRLLAIDPKTVDGKALSA